MMSAAGTEEAQHSLRVAETSVNANGIAGFRQIEPRERRAAVLKDAVVTGNGIDGGCTPSTCADVISNVVPRLKGSSTCETSLNPDTGASLGVCSLD